ncbi:MAG: S49 family peptidase [Marivibrio sp.]|uniref:S49 family peptidase n=1 Tax=Marivibrio sp. TaxID=2039719 RepID=UPI0032EC979C
MRKVGRILLWAFAVVGVLTISIVAAVTLFTLSVRGDAPTLPDQAVLSLDLTLAPLEQRTTQPLFDPEPEPTLQEMLAAIEAAADDPQIKALRAEVGGAGLGVAQAQELAEAIRTFRESGKPALAFASDLGALGDEMADVAVATAFSELWLQPSGGVGLSGIALEAPFFAEALNDLEIDPQVGQRHEFKGGIDPLIRQGYSEPVRRSLQRVVDGWVDQLAGEIAANRGMAPDAVRALVDRGPLLAREAFEAGLVDRIGYRDEAGLALDEALGAEADPVSVAHYRAARADAEAPARTVALIYGVGPIEAVEEPDPFFGDDSFGPARVAQAMEDALADDQIAAVLFRVTSPGGAYGPSDEVRRAVRRLREAGKPVIVSMGDVAASGGYMVSLDADRILASPGTLTGSIGVYSGKLATRGFWDSLGVQWGEVSAGENAGMWSFIDRFDPAERERFEAMLDFVYDDFTGHVARARNFSPEQLDQAARGRIWLGSDALEAGLVDRVGGFKAALEETRALLDLPADAPLDLRLMPEPKSPFEAVMEWIDGGGGVEEFADALITSVVARRVEPVTGDLTTLRALMAGPVAMPPIRRVE